MQLVTPLKSGPHWLREGEGPIAGVLGHRMVCKCVWTGGGSQHMPLDS